MDDSEILAIDATMKAQGKSRADLGRLLGLDSSQVSRTFSGKRRLQVNEHRLVLDWLGMAHEVRKPSAGSVIPLPGMVPLFGWVGAASEDQLTLAEPTMLGTVPIHPAQLNLRNGFAVRVHGDSMSPRYEHGEIVYVAPNHWPAKNQDCILETNDSIGYLKRFKRQQDGSIIMFQFNPEREVAFEIERIRTAHIVVGRG